MKLYARLAAFLLPFVISVSSPAAEKSGLLRIEIPPILTDTLLGSGGRPHIAMVDTSVVHRNRLLVFFGGTLSVPSNYLYFTTLAARAGYHVINLSYPNGVSSQACSDEPDTLCFEKFREEIIWGRDVSPCVSVDTANCIYARLNKVLHLLSLHYPADGWDNYIDRRGEPIFERMVLAGHSQGAGHAAFLAKQFAVSRVILFSGPNDWHTRFHMPARWLSQESATPPASMYSLLHRRDEIGFYKLQQQIFQRLVGFAEASDSVNVDRERPPYGHSRSLTSSRISPLGPDGKRMAHNATIMDAYTPRGGSDSLPLLLPAWRYLLELPSAPDSIEGRMLSASRQFRFEHVPLKDADGRFLYRFELPKTTALCITLFSLRGKKIRSLIDATVPPGPQTVVVDPARMKAGSYVLRLTTAAGWTAERILVLAETHERITPPGELKIDPAEKVPPDTLHTPAAK